MNQCTSLVAERPPKTDGWARIPWSVIDAAMGPHALAVYCAIARHAGEDGRAWPSMARIAEMAGVSKSKAKESVVALVDRGFMSRSDRRKADGSADSPLYRLPYAAGGGPHGDPRRPHGDPPVGRTVAGGGPHGGPEEEPLNKNHRKKRERAHTPPDPRLVFLIDQWNDRKLGPTVRRDPPPKDVLHNWDLMHKDGDARPLIESEAAIVRLLDSIPRNTWATAQSGWGIAWLLTRNKPGEWKAAKLLVGAYAATSRPTQASPNRCGPGAVYDPHAKERNPNHGTI